MEEELQQGIMESLPDIPGFGETENYEADIAEDVKASFRLTVPGSIAFTSEKLRLPPNEVDSSFSHNSPDAQELYNQYNIEPGAKAQFFDSRNLDHLRVRLDRHQQRTDDMARLQEEQPIAQYPMMMATSLLDPTDWVTMPLAFKVLGSIGTLKEASRLNNMVRAGTAVAIGATTSEALIQESSDAFDSEALKTTALFAGVLGAGVGAILPVYNKLPLDRQKVIEDEITGVTTTNTAKDLEAFARQVEGSEDFSHVTEGFKGKIEGWKSKLVWSPIANMMASTNPVVRGIGNVLETSPLALSDNGTIIKSSNTNAMNTKYKINGHYIKYLKTSLEDYKKYKLDNPDGYSLSEWYTNTGKDYRKFLGNIEREALDKYDEVVATGQRESIFMKAMGREATEADDIDDIVINYLKGEVAKNTDTPARFKATQEYYHRMQQEGELAGHNSFKGRNGKLYLNRVFNKDKIEEMGAPLATTKLYNALISSPVNQRHISDMIKEGISEDVIKADFEKLASDTINKIRLSSVYEEMDFRSINEMIADSPLKNRRLNIDETVADDLLINDISQLSEYYSFKTSGKIALRKHTGIETQEDINKYVKEITDEGQRLGHTPKQIAKDIDNFKLMVQSVNGTREIAQRPNTWGQTGARMFQKFNYVTLGGTFGLNTLGEIGSVVATNGIKSLKYMTPAIQDTINMYRKNPTKKITNEILSLGIGEQIYRSNRVSRYDSIDMVNTNNAVESLLDRGSNFMSNASGLNFTTTTLELMSGASTMEDLMSMVGRSPLTRAEQKRLARLGLDADDIAELARTNKAIYSDDGYLLSYNFDEWGNQELVTKIQNAIQESVKNAVLQADPTTVPAWATNPDNPLLRLATQFLRFPLAAHERLFLKGIDEASSKQAVGLLMSTGLMAMVYTLREEAMIQAGIIDEVDRKYDWETEEGIANLGKAVSTKIPFLGVTQTAYEFGDHLFNPEAKTYGTDSSTKLLGTFGRLNDVTSFARDIQDGELTEGNQKRLRSYIPFMTLPYLSPIYEALQKD